MSSHLPLSLALKSHGDGTMMSHDDGTGMPGCTMLLTKPPKGEDGHHQLEVPGCSHMAVSEVAPYQ